jgi:electron transport complex protein RnfB
MDITFLASILGLGFLGLLFGGGLAFASKKFEVKIDPRVETAIEILPGTNCGACGYPGCNAYAEAVIQQTAETNLCVPGGQEVATSLSKILGQEASEAQEPKVAIVQCKGGKQEATEKCIYQGLEDCYAAELIGGGSKACKYGCLGYGTCVRSCPFDAMAMDDNGLPMVIEENCTGCGVCVTVCPRDIMALIPKSQKVYLRCKSQDRGKKVKRVCSVGCTGCTLCANPKVTPSQSIKMEGFLPVIVDIHADDLVKAVDKCPANSFDTRDGEISKSVEITEQAEVV